MNKGLLVIAGPCSAETKHQVLSTAKLIDNIGGVEWFRAGIWKPRTMPNQFEGVGSRGLKWIEEVKETTSLKVMTEVANPYHVEKVLESKLDGVWIGARTTTNPFYVQEIVESLKGVDIPVFIKNPINPDINLWIGGIERFLKSGNNKIYAIHRGFSFIDNGKYRQTPYWQIPIELKRLMPQIPIICDPSHISGKSSLVSDIAKTSVSIGFDGLMLEVHNNPDSALTDKSQQITPKELKTLLNNIRIPQNPISNLESINTLRGEIDKLDMDLIDIISKRMGISIELAQIKKVNNIPILQINRWEEMIRLRLELAGEKNINKEFIKEIFEKIHEESIRIQGQ